MEFDVVVEGGKVLDGSGGAARTADVGIVGERIAVIGDLNRVRRRRTVDARDRFVVPGFVDLHAHSDLVLLLDGAATTKVVQGVTTEVVGNCGLSAAPFVADQHILGLSPRGCDEMLPRWDGVRSYLRAVEEVGPGLNVGALTGYGTMIRRSILDGVPASQRRRHLVRFLRSALHEGSLGLSVGLYYDPDGAAPRGELLELCRVVAAEGGLVAVHMRDEGSFTVGLRQSVAEVLGLAMRTGVRLQISHLKAIGPEGSRQLNDAVAAIEAARRAGIDVAADQYPYSATETTLSQAIRLSFAGEGTSRSEVLNHVSRAIEARGGPHRLVISHAQNPEVVGLTLDAIAERERRSPAAVALELSARGETTVISYALEESDVREILRLPWVAIASDGLALTPTTQHLLGRPHPRSAGAFPRVLAAYVRDEPIVDLSEAIRKMTALPSSRINLAARGQLTPDAYADVVVLNFERVRDRATFEDPLQSPDGIDVVIVNGQVAKQPDGQLSARSGQLISTGGRLS